MTATTAPPPTPRPSRSRVVATAAASVLALGALSSFAVGGAALYGDANKDAAGYLSTDFHRYSTDRSAIASEGLDVDTAGSGWLIDTDAYGKVRFRVESSTGKPVFVGLARAGDVDDYLRGTDHATVSELDFLPFDADYDQHPSGRGPAAPAGQEIWQASAQGTGRQTLTWDVENGEYSVVVMNADGSPGVDARVSAGADVPVLDDVGWGALGVGGALLVLAGALFAVVRRRKTTVTP